MNVGIFIFKKLCAYYQGAKCQIFLQKCFFSDLKFIFTVLISFFLFHVDLLTYLFDVKSSLKNTLKVDDAI